MKVLIDTTYAARAPRSGTAVYLEALVRELEAHPEVSVETAVNERRSPPAGGGVASARNAATDAWWAEMELPRIARRARADLIHHALPARAHGRAMPQVVTVYDLAFEALPQMFDRRFASYAHLTYRQAAAAADHIITISETTAEEVRTRWRIPSARITVARLGPGQPLPAVDSRPRRHFLYVGDAEPRKDLPTLLAAYAQYRAAHPAAVRQTAATATVAEDPPAGLILAGNVPDPDQPGVRVETGVDRRRLAELYAGALALVQPALYEGFGLTLLEGMASGTPVIAAASAAAVEVGADAVAAYPPGDRDALARRLAEIAGDPDRRAALTAAGRARAELFSWTECARRHVGAYSLAVQTRRGHG
ncbi:glycosyltransferase family 1 protein [Conexibacter sp. DBS9H8]|uniref:glycosyltransferase family 4 protein n=1 Tax=Conexibacter sp. DBS9H8 TaxID=2937801 RepID=UPI00200BE54D|nr:glycosyltransferase family 1 protein [Conexibacter sp. DBS9H8]